MNKKTLSILLFVLLVSTFSSQAEEPEYQVDVLFGGLIAWVHEPTNGTAWALLADLDYDSDTVTIEDLPPGATLDNAMEYHPHYSAIRIFGAKRISLGEETLENGEPIPLAGFEVAVRASGSDSAGGSVDIDQLADLRKIENHRTNGATARIPRDARKVDRRYLEDPVGSISTPHLNARVKILGGSLTAHLATCTPGGAEEAGPRPAKYLFKDPGKLNCASTASSTPLAELVKWTFSASGNLIFDLQKDGTTAQLAIEPVCNPECHPLTLEIVNSTDGGEIKSTASLEGSHACEDGHLRSFEAYYWFAEKPPFYWYHRLAPPAPYYSPCPADGFTAGDTKCPMIKLEP